MQRLMHAEMNTLTQTQIQFYPEVWKENVGASAFVCVFACVQKCPCARIKCAALWVNYT